MDGLCREGRAAEVSLRHIQKLARVLSLLFMIGIVFACIGCIIMVVVSICIATSNPQMPLSHTIAASIPTIISYAAGVLAAWCFARMFRDIANGGTPFTNRQARRFVLVALLLLIYVAAEALVPIHYENILQLENMAVGYVSSNPPISSTSIFIDAKAIGGAIICLCLSTIFKYGSLLQETHDGTV